MAVDETPKAGAGMVHHQKLTITGGGRLIQDIQPETEVPSVPQDGRTGSTPAPEAPPSAEAVRAAAGASAGVQEGGSPAEGITLQFHPELEGDWKVPDFAALMKELGLDGMRLDFSNADSTQQRPRLRPDLHYITPADMAGWEPKDDRLVPLLSGHDGIGLSQLGRPSDHDHGYWPIDHHRPVSGLSGTTRRLDFNWGAWDDLVAGPGVHQPLEVKAPPLSEVQADGLHPCGEYFAMPPLEDGKHTAWCDKVAVERALLEDPKAVSDAQGQVLSALARLGPLSKRQLIRATGLSGDLLGVLLNRPTGLDRDYEKNASLFTTHAGVLTQDKGKYQLSAPDDVTSRQTEALQQARAHVDEALTNLDQTHEVLQLAAPLVRGINPSVASELDPHGVTLGRAPDAHAAFGKLQQMGLIDNGQNEQQWLADWSKDPQTARQYWMDIGSALAGRVAQPLEQITGYQKLTNAMSGEHVSVPQSAVHDLKTGLLEAFGPLAQTDTASLINAAYVHALGSETPNVGPGVADLTRWVAGLDPVVARNVATSTLERLNQALQVRSRELSGFHDARIPSAQAIAEARAAQESKLQTADDWGKYLDSEYAIPSKVLERLQQLQANGQTDAVAVAGAVPFSDLSPRVGEVARQYMQAALQGNDKGREQAIRQFLELKRQGALGEKEMGDAVVPNRYVRLASSGFGGGNEARYRDNPYHVQRSRDAESLRELMGMSDATYEGARTLGEAGSKVDGAPDSLFVDAAVARTMVDQPRAERLRHEALALFCQTHTRLGWDSGEPLLRDSPGSLMMGGAGFEFMDLSRARDVTSKAMDIKAWARQNGKTFPLSAEDAQLAVQSRLPWGGTREPSDREGIDFGKLAAYSLDNRTSTIEPERVNDFFTKT
jgi:hypothetical protein